MTRLANGFLSAQARNRRAIATRGRQRGVALLAAILLVALGTIVAVAIAFQSAMTARRGTAALALDHSLLVAQSAEAIAAYALREDLKEDPDVDHPNEMWSSPLGPVEITPGVVLEAALEDMQGRFNLNSLVDANGDPEPYAVQSFEKLLELLDMETKWAYLIADWIDRDVRPDVNGGAEDGAYMAENPPYRTPNELITSTSELLALPEFGRERYMRLAPYVAALPQAATINVCSASGIVLDSLLPPGYRQYSEIDAETFTRNRTDECFPALGDFKALSNAEESDQGKRAWIEAHVDQKSEYFRLTSIATIGTAEFALYSLLHRRNELTRPILRSFAAE